MLTVGDKFPDYNLTGVTSNDMSGFKTFKLDNSKSWKVFFFYPKDFTFVCPTELVEFGNLNDKFKSLSTELYGVSTDSEFVHLAWRNSDKTLSDLPYPLLSDIKRELSSELGIIHGEEGVCLRATYIVDSNNIIRHVSVNDLSVGRNPAEILRTLEGLQNGGLIPCNWQPGQEALKVG